jgi:translation initiation factor 5B
MTTSNKNIPCCAILGHVDVGKTKLLDYMRKTKTEEASGITQQMGMTLYDRTRLEELVGDKLKTKFSIDSLLIIDTPGHEQFDLIRNVASKVVDVVILMIDIIKGIEEQTVNIISNLLKSNIPFIICLNKMDTIYEWKVKNDNTNDFALNLANVLKRMSKDVLKRYEDYVRKIQNKLYEYEITSKLYYDKTNSASTSDTVLMVPISAKTGEGIPDLILLISAMAEKKYFSDKLIETDITHGYILDLHYDKNYGNYYVALHRNGSLNKGDTILICNNEKITRYQIKTILLHPDNKEMKDDHKFLRSETIDKSVKSIGIGLIIENADKTFAKLKPGSMYVLESNVTENKITIDDLKEQEKTSTIVEYESRWTNCLCSKDIPGIYVVAPSHIMMDGLMKAIMDSNESKSNESKNSGEKCKLKLEDTINISRYKIGKIDKKDMIMAGRWMSEIGKMHDELYIKRHAVILSYDPSIKELPKELHDSASVYKIVILHSNVIYKLLESYNKFLEGLRSRVRETVPRGMVQVIPKFIFRTSDPMIFGITVKNGTVKIQESVYTDEGLTNFVGKVESLQINNKNINEAVNGQEVCIKINSKNVVGKAFTNDAILWIAR